MKAEVRALWTRRVGIGSAAIAVVCMLITTTYAAVTTRVDQITNAQTNEATNRGTSRIVECTTPGRKCFNESTRRIANAVTGVNEFSVQLAPVAAGCAARYDTDIDAIAACITRELRAREER